MAYQVRIITNNKEYWILEKPYNLACQGGEGVKFSLEDSIRQELYEEPFLVHRLDKETSGLILVAKNAKSAGKYATLFKQNYIEKRYRAIVFGKFPKTLSINDDIITKGKIQEANTEAKLIKTYDNFSLVSLKINTGRMHQIRKHLSKQGYPIIGDDKYGDFALNRLIKKTTSISNLMLQANFLAIQKERVEASLELPNYFEDFLKQTKTLSPIIKKELK